MYVLIALIFFIRGIIFLDPDFGWHLQNGALIAKEGIFRTDPYSYTMPSFPVVSHEWSIDLLWHVLFEWFGKWGISLIWAGIVVVTLWILVKGYKNAVLLAILLAAGTLLPFFGNRPQVVGWLLLAILMKILLYSKTRSAIILIPLFIFWANIHGSFAVGILALGVVCLIRKKFLILFAATASTLINLFGIQMWGEVWSSISDGALRSRIQEWQPALFTFNIPWLFLMVLAGTLLFRYRKKFLLEEKILYVVFLLGAWSSVRHIPLFVVIAVPILLRGFSFLQKEVSPNREASRRLKIAMRGLVMFVGVVVSAFMIFVITNTVGQSYYPSQAIEFLKENKTEGNIFSSYNWGGYLIWKLPEKKVFIDGRMPSWPTAMEEYLDIESGKKHFKVIFNKYSIDTVLWLKADSKNTNSYDFLFDLERNGWVKVYEDSTAVVYRLTASP